MERNSNLIYFNNNRTTRQAPEVTACMAGMESEVFHETGATTLNAKQQLGALIGASPEELLFTSGTTESVNLALKAAFHFYKNKGAHIITNVTEHFAVLDCCKELEQLGAEITYLGVNREGLMDVQELEAAIRPGTIVVCLMATNNETGVIQPIEKIGALCAGKNIFFFSDASQFAGKERCDSKELGFGGLAFGAHKMHGPDGIGLLYIDQRFSSLGESIRQTYTPKLSAAQVAGFGKAAEICLRDYWDTSTHISRLKNYFEHQLLDLEEFRINGSTRYRLYNTSNVTFSDHTRILPLLERFDFAENVKKPSYVLAAMGLSSLEIKNSFRFSFGKYNTLDEVKLLVEELIAVCGTGTNRSGESPRSV